MSYGNQPGQNPLGYPNQFYPPPPQRPRGPNWTLIVLGTIGGGALLFVLACCGGIAYLAQPPQASAAARQPFSVVEVPLATFGERGAAVESVPGVLHSEAPLGDGRGFPRGGYYSIPGQGGVLHVYLPPGEHAPKSLTCILIAGAGTNLLTGMDISEGDVPEHLPYVQAGMAVVAYELDGNCRRETATDTELARAYQAFQAARAGLVNQRNALEFVLRRLPEVDPKRIYQAGHSSAGTHALLAAAHEPRLAGCLAYAPAVDLPQFFSAPEQRAYSFIMPGVVDFITQSSPSTHRERIKCPTFFFFAEDDFGMKPQEMRAFAEQLKQQGTDVTLLTVPSGGHYDSMINEGVPAGIKWLQSR